VFDPTTLDAAFDGCRPGGGYGRNVARISVRGDTLTGFRRPGFGDRVRITRRWSMSQFHFDPQTYHDLVTAEVPDYPRLQDEVAAATTADARRARHVLDLGAGTGETSRRVLAAHPGATLVALDENPGMLDRARPYLPGAQFVVGRLEQPLPAGPFDLVISALAIHHLDAAGKADLFARICAVLAPGGRFVLGDLVVPPDPADAVTPANGEHDRPSPLTDQLTWLRHAGLEPTVTWTRRDLAVVAADRPGSDI